MQVYFSVKSIALFALIAGVHAFFKTPEEKLLASVKNDFKDCVSILDKYSDKISAKAINDVFYAVVKSPRVTAYADMCIRAFLGMNLPRVTIVKAVISSMSEPSSLTGTLYALVNSRIPLPDMNDPQEAALFEPYVEKAMQLVISHQRLAEAAEHAGWAGKFDMSERDILKEFPRAVLTGNRQIARLIKSKGIKIPQAAIDQAFKDGLGIRYDADKKAIRGNLGGDCAGMLQFLASVNLHPSEQAINMAFSTRGKNDQCLTQAGYVAPKDLRVISHGNADHWLHTSIEKNRAIKDQHMIKMHGHEVLGGSVAYDYDQSPTALVAYIHGLVSNVQGSGTEILAKIGSRLEALAQQTNKRQGIMYLSALKTSDALGFYKKLGFRLVDRVQTPEGRISGDPTMVVEAPGTTNTALVYRFLFDKKGHFFSFANKNDNEEAMYLDMEDRPYFEAMHQHLWGLLTKMRQ